MKTLYIPTTTLNFNNILSSESISPKAFYEQRGFGYNRWNSIPENDMSNAILLYEKLFTFSRPDNGLEDHPMFVEIKTDEDFPPVGDGVGVYYCDHTIYLSPWRAKFIFLSDEDEISTKSMSESSIETKMVPLYKKRLDVDHSISGQAPSFTRPDVPLNEKAIDDDRWVNKMKGLLYGYYIGALLSTTPESVERVNTLQEIRNIFSSILSNEHRQPTPMQDERLGELFNKMNYTSPVFKVLKPLNDDDGKIMDAIRQLWKCGCLTNGFWTDKDNMLRLLTCSTAKHNEAFTWLEEEESKLKKEMNSQSIPLKVSDDEIITNGKGVTKISDKVLPATRDRDVTMAWLNDILSLKEYNGKIGTFNKELSDKLTSKAKEIYGSEWDGSDAKRELNQMRRFIAGAEAEFTWTNGYIPSMAAVLLKGDDWDKLLAFMRSKSMYDYRIAFAFYGELNGFANLTRDFTDVLLTADKYYLDKKSKKKKQECMEKINKAIEHTLDNFLPSRSKADRKMVNGETGGEKTTARVNRQLQFSESEDYDIRGGERSSALGDENLFINDVNVSAFIEQRVYLPEDIRRDIVRNLKLFQESYRKGYYYRKRKQYQRNNGDTIEHFIKVCFKPRLPNEKRGMKSVRGRYDNISGLMDRLKKDLIEKYHE